MKRQLARGYTAIEVLLAMTVLAIGAAGVMSMQKGAIQGNLDARKLDMANSIAREWIERLRRDSTVWTLPSGPNPGVNNFADAVLIQPNVGAPLGAWFLPNIPAAYPAEGLSPAFDILGRDLDRADAANAIYCVHVKLDVLTNDPVNPLLPELLRATVRVFWLKQLSWASTPPFTCAASNGQDPVGFEAKNPGTYHLAYASTVIRKNQLP